MYNIIYNAYRVFFLLSLYKPGALSDGYTRLKSIFYRQPNRKTAAKLKTKNVYTKKGATHHYLLFGGPSFIARFAS